MVVLAHQGARFAVCSAPIICPYNCDIDKQSGRSVYLPSVNNVRCIRFRPNNVVRVDFQKISSSAFDIRKIEMMLGHVIVVGKEVNHRLADLDVEIVVSRENLPPSVKMSTTKRLQGMPPFDSITRLEVIHALSRFRHGGQPSLISMFG